MKKIILSVLIIIIIGVLYSAWNIFGSTVSVPEKKYFYVKTGSTYDEVLASLEQQGIIKNKFFFNLVAKQAEYPSKVRPGRYEIAESSSVYSLVRKLKAGSQAPVRLVINKLRTKEDLAEKLGANFEFDSTDVLRYIFSNDSLKQDGLDTNTVMTVVIPDTYLLNWNGSFKKVFNRLIDERNKFWNKERLAKAAILSLEPAQVYSLASIVEEESNHEEDKKLIASVYINRLKKNMKLQADPTVKYALRDFSIKRILFGHLKHESPYNTYYVTGLPPGPICTPSRNTLDAVLNAPATDYIFFAAKPDFGGQHNFAATYEQHKIYAKQYQQALDSLIISRSK